MRPILLCVCALAAGCAKKRDPAPTEMTDLVRFLFANWEDPAVLPEAVDNLGGWIDENIDTPEATDGLLLDVLTEEDISSVDHPDKPLTDVLGVAGEAHSAFPVEDHAAYLVLADQTFSNPQQYKTYVRTITEGKANAFAKGEVDDDGELIRTMNDITTATLGIEIPYTMHKDYRWVEGETERAVIGRAWIEERSCNDGGSNCVEHTYSIDVFYADGAQKSQRMTASWSDVGTSIPVSDDLKVASLAGGIQNVFQKSEEFLEDGG
jgi:hypothetical protein